MAKYASVLLKSLFATLALAYCREHLGEDATLLYCDTGVPFSIMAAVKAQGKEAGGQWECYNADRYFGWEAERIVAVTSGDRIMEMITRAKIQLTVILVGEYGYRVGETGLYHEWYWYFHLAEKKGLVEILNLPPLMEKGD